MVLTAIANAAKCWHGECEWLCGSRQVFPGCLSHSPNVSDSSSQGRPAWLDSSAPDSWRLFCACGKTPCRVPSRVSTIETSKKGSRPSSNRAVAKAPQRNRDRSDIFSANCSRRSSYFFPSFDRAMARDRRDMHHAVPRDCAGGADLGNVVWGIRRPNQSFR